MTMLEIAQQVSERTGVTLEAMRSLSTEHRVARARHAAMVEMRRAGKWSTTQIGRLFNRDHSTVTYAERRYGGRG